MTDRTIRMFLSLLIIKIILLYWNIWMGSKMTRISAGCLHGKLSNMLLLTIQLSQSGYGSNRIKVLALLLVDMLIPVVMSIFFIYDGIVTFMQEIHFLLALLCPCH